MASNLPKPSPIKSFSKQFQENITFVIVGSFILYYIGMFFDFLFRPLFNSGTPYETEKRIREKIYQKQDARKRIRAIYNKDMNDPMNQFKLRFVDEPDNYKEDSDNKIFYEWFQQWKKGNVLDSTLRWAPSIYDNSKEMKKNFLDYMKIQFDLHKRVFLFKRFVFINTINKYYPEFTASMNGLENDLSCYDTEITEKVLQRQLRNEIQKYGLPEEISSYLIEENIENLEDIVKMFKSYTEKGISADCAIYCFKNKITDMEEIEGLNIFTEKTGLPYRVGLAFIKDQINSASVDKIIDSMNFAMESYGSSIYDYIKGKNVTAFDSLIDEYLKQEKEKCAANSFNERD